MSSVEPSTAKNHYFPTNSRFSQISGVGEGAMCVVFKARDLRFGDVVALKTLHQLDPNSLYRLKQEFRALSTIDHPNLVSFYELVGSAEGWFVTMELVEGEDFLRWCRRTDTGSLHRFDEIRLRSALRQLVEGVATLHESGHIHRDLKAENVLVTASGRVVILDFGLVLEHDMEFTEGTLHKNLAGSAAYMSPEQSLGETVGPASDWYSVGVMLYESLTGRWPYEGNIYEILMAKHEQDPVPPSSLVPDVPADLNRLCMALLARRPLDRPVVNQILAQLASRRPMLDVRGAADYNTRLPFFAHLKRFFDKSCAEGVVICRVSGSEGVGKTGIVREFIRRLKREGQTYALKSRCYEWERVPFKALDGLLDNLTRVLRRHPKVDLSAVSDEQLACLGHLFPVVRRVDALDKAMTEQLKSLSRIEKQKLALDGFCSLLESLSESGSVLLFVDDVQWADVQSADFLMRAVIRLRSRSILALLCDDGEKGGGFIRVTERVLIREGLTLEELKVRPLPLDEAAAVAGSLLRMPTHRDLIQEIARQSAGAPARILELSRLELLRNDATRMGATGGGIDTVIKATIDSLPAGARRLLRLIAIAGPSVLTDVVVGAAALGESSFDALSTLRAHQLIDVTAWIFEDRVEIASAELRDFLVVRLPALELESLYYDLAIALELSDEDDPRSLVRFYIGSGHFAKASMVAMRAARGAQERGRHAEVAWLLERALELGDWSEIEQRGLYLQLAQSRALVGVGGQVARVYEAAMKVGDGGNLRRFAVEQWLAAGQVFQGESGLKEILKEGRWPWQGTPFWRKMSRRSWDQDYAWPTADSVATNEASALCGGLSRCALALAWTERSLGYWVHMKTRAMLPEHPGFEVLASVTLNEALYCAFQRRDYEEALQRCLELAERFGSRRVLAFERSVRGYILLLEGRWAEALIHAGEGLSALAEHCPEQLWQRRHTRFVILRAQLYRGAWGDISEQLREMKVGPVDEDNLLWKTMLASGVGAWIRMAEDEAEVGIQETIESLRSWPSTTFWQPQAYAISALGNLYLYIGEFDEAWALLRSSWRLIKNQSHQLDPCLIAEIAILRAKIALQIAKRGQRVEHWVRVARTSMDIAANEKLPWVDGMVFVLEALIEQLNGVGDGREGLLKAYAHFGEVDMQMHVAILAIVLEGGVEDPLAARNWLSEQGVRDLRRFAAVMVPTA